MRVVVTGATSMIGVALIEECVKNHCEVLAIVRKDTNKWNRLPPTSLIRIEYADLDSLQQVKNVGEVKYDVFYHLAWMHTEKAGRDNPIMQEKNIQATLAAVELANRLGCKKFIGAGSQAEYGRIHGVILEETRPEPVSAYGMAKLSANYFSRKLCGQLGMQHIWGRIFSVYGKNDRKDTMLSYAVDQFLNGKTAKFSAATQMWNYLYESDAGKMFYLLGAKDIAEGVYCIANYESKKLRDYIEILRKQFDQECKCHFSLEDSNLSINLNVDVSKVLGAIGFYPQVSFEEGCREIISYQEKLKTWMGK